MMQIVEARCPGCKSVLRIPSNWLNQPLKCKNCQLVFQDKRASVPPPKAVPVAPPMRAIPVVPAKTSPRRRGRKIGGRLAFVGAWLVGIGALAYAVHWAMTSSTDRPRSTSGGNQVASASRGSLGSSPFMTVDPFKPPEPGPTAAFRAPELPAIVIPKPPEPPKQPRIQPKGQNPVSNVPPPPANNFPRRALLISANNNIYAGPIANGPQGRDLRALSDLMSRGLSVPTGQVFDLSDVGQRPRPPRKGAIESAVTKFLDTSRAQDRIVILFVGHAVEIEEIPYLVPIDGELDNKATLIPLSWLYDRMAKSRARQKILILDVCRTNAIAGDEGPSGGAMGAKLDAALLKPPLGIQVWSSCIAEQRSYDLDSYANNTRSGVAYSAFLGQLIDGLGKMNTILPSAPDQKDSIPIAALAKVVNEQTKTVVEGIAVKTPLVQTPRLTGAEPTGGAAFNDAEPPAPTIDLDPPAPGGDLLALADLQALLKEVEMPPMFIARAGGGSGSIAPDAMPSFLSRFMDSYKDDVADTPLRTATRNAVAVLNKELKTRRYKDSYGAPQNDAQFKTIVLTDQQQVSRAIGSLQETLDELKKAAETRDGEKSKRWQANYDYVLARLMLHLGYLVEYQTRLGDMRKELPERDPAKQQGWLVMSVEKLTGDKLGKDLVKEAKKILDKIVKEHPNTPWEVLAKHDKTLNLGLNWQGARLR